MSAPVFFYDFSSPYAYLASLRIDELLPEARWQPIVFGIILQRDGRIPWSFGAQRGPDFDEIARRAAERGVPELRYPEGWPRDSYSLHPLRAAAYANTQGRLREFTAAAYRRHFVECLALNDPDVVVDAAVEAGLDADAARAALGDQAMKDQVRAWTDDAVARGVPGVPTVAVGDELFWGDDRLEEAAAAARTIA